MKNNTKETHLSFKSLKTATKIKLLLLAIAAAVIFALVFKRIASYELHHAYNWDSPLYWTVGRGMLNGLKPYTDLYENKPLGVFLISAFSFWLTDDTIICNIISVLSVLLIAVLPVIAVCADHKNIRKSDASIIRYALTFFTVLLVGVLMAVYVEKRAGSFQAEAIGAAFSTLFIILVKMQSHVKTGAKRNILIAGSALAISCAVMLKEPFLLVSVFGAMLFVDSFKDFFRYIIIPCLIGCLIIAAVLAVSGVIVPYFTVYLKQMLAAKITENSSVLWKSLNVLRLFKDLKKVSILLMVTMLLFVFFALVRIIKNRKNTAHLVFNVIKIIIAVYAASFCVSIGGQYFPHHFVFAVPVYCAILIFGAAFLLEYAPGESAPNFSVLVLSILVLLAAAQKTGSSYKAYNETYDSLKTKAEYVDELLDSYQAERYQFIGFNYDEKFFGLTKHSPQGPVFVQDPINFTDTPTWFSESFSSQLETSDVIIVDQYSTQSLRRCVRDVVKKDFIIIPEDKLAVSPPEEFECVVYLRASKYG